MEHGNPDTNPGESTGKTPLRDAVDDCVLKKDFSPNYEKNFRRVVGEWIDYCEGNHGVTTVEGVTQDVMGSYGGWLSKKVEKKQEGDPDGISKTTAWTYYDSVSALLDWAATWNIISENPAVKGPAQQSLGKRPSNSEFERQYWQPEQREVLIRYLDRRAESALTYPIAPPPILHKRLRNYALVATIAYSGVRGGEILNDPNDPRRTGLTWGDVDLDSGVAKILGKDQETEPAQFPGQSVTPLRKWKRRYDPPSDNWPVFPSMHIPTLSKRIRQELGADERDRRTATTHHWTVLLDAEIEPPSITTEGARSLLKRLSERLDVPGIDSDDDEYLTLHGARRGVGETLYRERGHERAQRTLRHADPSTTSQMYSHIETAELAEDNTEVFEDG